MKRLPSWILLLLVYAALCGADYQPISGALLDYWLDPSAGYIPTVSDVDAGQLPADVYELRIVCLEVAEDSLDVFLLGLVPDTDIPLLMASGGYRGLYNLTRMVASYHPGEDAIHVAFQMPYSATFLFGDYRWNRESQALELLRSAPRILRQLELPLETHLWVPVHLDGCEVTEDGGLRLRLSRRADPSTFVHGVRDLWTILIDPDGAAASLESLDSSSGIRLTTGTLLAEMPESLFLIACTEGGDTLWTYPLASDEYCHSAFVTAAEGGDLLVSIHPDCFSDVSSVERLSDSGRSVFGQVLSTFTLLGLPPRDGETSPMVLSQALTSMDDVLLTGYVREWMTNPAAWFVCLLDGATGELLWKAVGFGLGESEISDAIELPGGGILATGSTWEWDENHITFGTPQPFLVMLDPSGRVLDSLILDESTGGFQSLIAHPAGGDRFLLAHSGGDPERLTILEMNIPTDQDSWSASWQGRSGETSSKSLSRPRRTCRLSSSCGL